MKHLKAAWGGMWLFASAALPAQGGDTLDGLVAMAYANNAELRAYEAEVAAAKGQRTQAGYFKNPEVSIEAGGREVRDTANVLQGNGTAFAASIMQTFEFPGKGSLRKAIANKNIEIAELGLQQFRLALAGKVRLCGLEYLAAENEASAAESVYDRSSRLAGHVSSRDDFGANLQIESRLVQAGLIELGGTIKSASHRREEARTKLNALLGRPQGLPLQISDSLSPPRVQLRPNEVVFSAQKYNPLLKIRQREIEKSARELTAARLDVAPDLAIGPFFSRDVAGDTEQNLGGGATATVPVWDWNAGNIQTAKARQSMAEAMRVKAEREVEAEILSRLKAYELTQEQLGRIPAEWIADIRNTSTLADAQFRNGSIGAQLYLDSQASYLNALRTSQEATLEAWRILFDLDLLAGGHLEPRRAKP